MTLEETEMLVALLRVARWAVIISGGVGIVVGALIGIVVTYFVLNRKR